jgi:hypothetical protein
MMPAEMVLQLRGLSSLNSMLEESWPQQDIA